MASVLCKSALTLEQSIRILDLPMPNPLPIGAEWIEAL
jgi:hypothetical protein